MPQTDPSNCTHCGLPVPAAMRELGKENGEHDSELHFCCSGCKRVYELIHQLDLQGFYSLRQQEGSETTRSQPIGDTLASPERFQHFDDEERLRDVGGQPGNVDLHIVGIHCSACIWLIERLAQQTPGVRRARVRLDAGLGSGPSGQHRIHLEWDPKSIRLSQIAAKLAELGYELHAFDNEAERARKRLHQKEVVRLAVAGACAGNVMLMSFAHYAGVLENSDGALRELFRWGVLVFALPAVVYAALPFYKAAWSALRLRKLHLDLPISLGILFGFVASSIATLKGNGEVYFDSVATLVFLLLAGRFVQQKSQSWFLSKVDLLEKLLPLRRKRFWRTSKPSTSIQVACRSEIKFEYSPEKPFRLMVKSFKFTVLAGARAESIEAVSTENPNLKIYWSAIKF